MWALKILHEKNWRECLRVLEYHHPPNFPEFLQPLRDLGIQRVTLFLLGFLHIWFWDFIGLAIIRSPRSVINRS